MFRSAAIEKEIYRLTKNVDMLSKQVKSDNETIDSLKASLICLKGEREEEEIVIQKETWNKESLETDKKLKEIDL